MNNEEYLKQRLGSPRNPFKVPDGYFDNFTQELMEKLPEKNAALTIRRKPVVRAWMYAAASVVVAVFTISAYFLFSQKDDAQAAQFADSQASSVITESYVDDAVDYAMLDNHEIYAALYSE